MSDQPNALMQVQLTRFESLRQRLFRLIGPKTEHGCKSYEGALSVRGPDYFQERGQDSYRGEERWELKLDCYVLGPSRHYEWYGDTLDECMDQLEAVIASEERGEYDASLWGEGFR